MLADQKRYELKSKLHEAISEMEVLNDCISSISTQEKRFLIEPSPVLGNQFQRLDDQINERYKTSLEKIETVIHLVNQMLTRETPNGDSMMQLPSRNEVKSMLTTLFLGKIKTRKPPVPVHCGCYAWKSKEPHPGAFICAHYRNAYRLMIVMKWEKPICTAFDPEQIANGAEQVEQVELNLEEWTPLPTVFPSRPLGRWEHQRGAKVLALMVEPGMSSGWPCEFEKACVIDRPCDRASESGGNDEDRGYRLDFNPGGPPLLKIISEQFVVNDF